MDYILCKRRQKVHHQLESIEEIEDRSRDSSKSIAKKCGFVTLKDRVRSLTAEDRRISAKLVRQNKVESVKSKPQYATLQELFSANSTRHHHQSQAAHYKRVKIPVMRLTKDDWNVKCWEERLEKQQVKESGKDNRHGDNRQAELSRMRHFDGKVFKSRVDDVATKLDRAREGLPQDQELHRLTNTRTKPALAIASSHEFTDLIKRELEVGEHTQRSLRKNLDDSLGGRWTLKKPIKRLFSDDDEDKDDE